MSFVKKKKLINSDNYIIVRARILQNLEELKYNLKTSKKKKIIFNFIKFIIFFSKLNSNKINMNKTDKNK